jgi:hypothetical protein
VLSRPMAEPALLCLALSTCLDEPSRLETINEFGRVAETAIKLGCKLGNCPLTVKDGKHAELAFGEHLLRSYEPIFK